jgi:PTH2 family peptidyl-tRNA hydrolase
MSEDNEVTQYIIVRSDLGMKKGKMAAQVAHAAVLSVRKVEYNGDVLDRTWLQEWEDGAYAKIVLRADTFEQFKAIVAAFESEELLHSIVTDAGRTQIEAGSMTAVGLQPMPRNMAKPVVGHLSLL